MRWSYSTNLTASITVLSLAVSLLIPSLVGAKTYRWVDSKGVVHYSESIPPSQAKFGHKELNEKNGSTIKNVESNADRIKKEKSKLAAAEKEERLKKELREELMIYMFSSKKELRQHFKQKIKMISVNIRLLEYHKKKLSLDIAKIKNHLANKPNKSLRKKLNLGLIDLKQSMIDHAQAIKTNHDERSLITEQMVRSLRAYTKNFGNGPLTSGSLIGDSAYQRLRQTQGAGVINAASVCDCGCNDAASND
ncbi:MAG TPA: DUF4124 domain-containing protein [Thiotrichaceae bacterium]|nr:DUF4124 domain-containing protein [Thiotrichaceae bacterium]